MKSALNNHEKCGCGYWIVAPDDQFCGWCGNRFSGFTCRLTPEDVFLGGGDFGKKNISLRVTNTGRQQLKILDIHITPAEALAVVKPPSDAAPAVVPPHGGTLDFDLMLDLIRPPNEFQEIELRVLSNLKGEEKAQTKTLRLMPAPAFTLRAEELLLVLDERNHEENRVVLRIEDGRAEIKEIRADVPWAKAAVLDMDLPVEMRTDRRRDLIVQLNINEKLLLEAISSEQIDRNPARFNLAVICRGMESKPFEFPIAIPTRMPAKLGFRNLKMVITAPGKPPQPRLEAEVFIGGRRQYFSFPVIFENKGDMPLKIEEIKVPNSPAWLELAVNFDLKKDLSPGASGDLVLKINAGAIAAGVTKLDLQFRCNDPFVENSTAALAVVVTAKTLTEYPGIVAIDFGTTNTCVAVYNPRDLKAEPKVLELNVTENLGSKTSVPSVIFYRKLHEDNRRDYIVGKNAASLVGVDGTEESIVTSIKRKLGHTEPLKVRFHNQPETVLEIKPEEIAGDIIQELFAEVELHLKAKVSSCVFSHPVQYVHRRIEALEDAFKMANVKTVARLTEPLGAALDYIFQKIEETEKSYTLMVWDFGGGTTDVAFLQVEVQKDEKDTKTITPKLLGADGDRRFGGNDVTKLIMDYFADEIAQKLEPENQVLTDLEQIKRIEDTNARTFALSNYMALFNAAESAKIQVANAAELALNQVSNDNIVSLPAQFTLKFWSNGKEKELASPSLILSLQKLEDLTGPAIDGAIMYMIDVMERNNDILPDVILLAGNSSRLPVVHKLMEKNFGRYGSKIIGAGSQEKDSLGRYKESVVVGLCRSRMARQALSGDRVKELEVPLVATSNIGFQTFRGGQIVFEPIIKKGDPLNQWRELHGVVISADAVPTLMSCSGRSNSMKDNPYMEFIAEFPLEKLSAKFTDDDLKQAALFLMIKEKEEVVFKVQVGEHDEVFSALIPPTLG